MTASVSQTILLGISWWMFSVAGCQFLVALLPVTSHWFFVVLARSRLYLLFVESSFLCLGKQSLRVLVQFLPIVVYSRYRYVVIWHLHFRLLYFVEKVRLFLLSLILLIHLILRATNHSQCCRNQLNFWHSSSLKNSHVVDLWTSFPLFEKCQTSSLIWSFHHELRRQFLNQPLNLSFCFSLSSLSFLLRNKKTKKRKEIRPTDKCLCPDLNVSPLH